MVARQVAWARARLHPSSPTGFRLTLALAIAALSLWAFGALTQDAVGGDEMALVDPKLTSWIVAHRVGGLTAAMKVLTWLGSTAVIVPLAVALGGWFLVGRRDWRPLAMLAVAVGGVIATHNVVKLLVQRARPPASVLIGHFTGSAFPSGHASQAAAFYAMAAILVGAGLPVRARVVTWAVAATLCVVVGFSRLYLGEHWLTDVLGGYALGIAWVSLVAAVTLTMPSRGSAIAGAGRPREPKGHAQ